MRNEKTGGRTKGTPNKRTQELCELMEDKFPGYNPVVQMAGIALDKDVEINIRVQCAKEVAQYLYPKRKAVELKGEIEAGPVMEEVTRQKLTKNEWLEAHGLRPIANGD